MLAGRAPICAEPATFNRLLIICTRGLYYKDNQRSSSAVLRELFDDRNPRAAPVAARPPLQNLFGRTYELARIHDIGRIELALDRSQQVDSRRSDFRFQSRAMI